jgi:glycosyltransferase involved in cell wall biosynthesis
MMAWLFFVIYGCIMIGIIGLGYFLQRRKERNYFNGSQKISIDQVAVIIPFRNEAVRLSPLLESIEKARVNPCQYVFVDDHSDDGSADLIDKKRIAKNALIIELNDNEEGKKVAIRRGIIESSGQWVLSMDADVRFQSEYYSILSQLEEADMYVLPAVMVAKRWYEHLYEVDLILVNAANCGLSGWKRPIMASGANLLYRRAAFDQFDQFERHSHMPSGDDIYLLRDFRESAADVRLITDPTLAIHTETPQTFNEFIHQRLRWLAKTGDVKDHLSTSLAIIQALLTFSFVALLVEKGIQKDWGSFWMIFGVKTGIDMLLFFPYFLRIRRLMSWLFIPLYEFLFPFYTLLILSMMYWFKPKWKGRKLQRNF